MVSKKPKVGDIYCYYIGDNIHVKVEEITTMNLETHVHIIRPNNRRKVIPVEAFRAFYRYNEKDNTAMGKVLLGFNK